MVEKRCLLQREGVYRWFSQLNSSKRAEFLCGLLDLCVPIELRFLGSCLEDLARKDYHSLRDAEIKANNPADLANLTNITDEVVRSKLLISLALLNSDNRGAAGVLFRTLTHIDSVINNYGLQLNDGQTGDQFLLLFTMASNHPAFSFHQKQVLRQELTQIQSIVQAACSGNHASGGTSALAALTAANTITTYITNATLNSCPAGFPCSHKALHREERTRHGSDGSGLDSQSQASSLSGQELLIKVHAGKTNKANIERIELKSLTQKAEKAGEYTFEVLWSDSTVSVVSRTSQDVMEFLSKISQLFPDDGLEKYLSLSPLDPPHQPDPRCLAKLPPHLLMHEQVRQFFSPAMSPQFPPNTNFGCSLQYRGASSLPRPVCGVASIQPVISSHCPLQPHSATHFPSPGVAPRLPSGGGPTGDCLALVNPASNPRPPGQANLEQNGILDWLRKLRLHKYYPVFKQLTMEKFLALTEEDLNKYDLTQGAKKKLKTQLELQNREKSEKRYVLSQFPVTCGGVARVAPSSHIAPSTSSAELRVEVDSSSHLFPRDSGSSSGYSSSPSSPMAPRDEALDRVKASVTSEPRRRTETGSEPGDRERTCVLLNHTVPSGPSRPTAQVLPVQNDACSSSSPYHLPLPPQVLPLLSPGRVLGPPRKPRPPPPPPSVLSPLCSEDRAKPMCPGVAVGMQLESRFPGLSLEMAPALLSDGPAPGAAPQGTLAALRSPPGLMVETSTAPTATSNTLHHVSRPPLQPQLSPSVPPTSPHRTGHFSASWSAFPTASSIAVVTAPESTRCAKGHPGPSAPPTSGPVSTETGSGGAGGQPPTCVCSSCGCSGSCGSYCALPAGYAGYFQHPFSGPSVLTLGPLLHLSPLLAGPHPQSHSASAPFSYPLVAPPLYSGSLPHETQAGLVLPPMQGFLGAAAGIYQPQVAVGNAGGEQKKGNVSCYNCGVSGHWAQDCKQPLMESGQQGTFRLKYAPPSDSQDSAD
ncbi:LOW QUALITY PROTEIN: zinc finger CCHC domain-containing protein 14 [Brienomyrus brachyistius]|uniref:LOW QUALITY PROTEIN: zinc finger CCHC domain-containing protein 14 n=1 Tax=Brienomyrus brachyistius TaxID=42636 RepID=UPI0020B19771|nr:LOW QUALITY PROTEIN: zinc finger CCHC domain-containing protein 14 [Brienomyrus brachyistius]